MDRINRAFRVDAFLVFYYKNDVPLAPPLQIQVNGVDLQRPFLAVSIDGLKQCFVIARFSPTRTQQPFHFSIRDHQDVAINWTERHLAARNGEDRDLLPAADIAQLCGKIYRHLGQNFGGIDAAAWQRITHDLAGLAGTTVFRLADERIYFRAPCSAPSTRSLLPIELASAEKLVTGEPGAKSWALLDNGWLHGVCHLAQLASATGVAKRGELACIPISALSAAMITAMDDPLAALVQGYDGDCEAVRAFLHKVHRLRNAPPAASPAPQRTIQGAISALQGDCLLGWALDQQSPERPLALELLVDGLPVATVHTTPSPLSVTTSAGMPGAFAWQCGHDLLDGEAHRVELHSTDQPQGALGEPFSIGYGQFDGQCALSGRGTLEGWFRERCQSPLSVTLELDMDGTVVEQTAIPASDTQDTVKFAVALPRAAHDGNEHRLAVHLLRDGKRLAGIGPTLRYQSRFNGAVDTFSPGFISGWIVIENAQGVPVTLDLRVDGEVVASGKATRTHRLVDGRPCGFEFAFPQAAANHSHQTLSLCIAGTATEVLGPHRISTPYASILRTLVTASRLLRQTETAPGESEWVRRQVLAPLIADLRRAGELPESATLKFSPMARLNGNTGASNPVDVIVPVYKGLRQTLDCLQSVIRGAGNALFRLVVVNDCSPDATLSETLREWARQRRIVLLENERNLGFVAAVNRGMRLAPDRDVVLLNADTLVPPRWLDRLVRIARAQPSVGTITPFSNNATIASFPIPCAENAMPDGWSVQELDAEFQRANGDRLIDLPTAIGFCMYIKRQVLDEVGYFDEDQWGKGYGEENDFSLRASVLGWRHVLACGLFVQHHGCVSFEDGKSSLLTANLQKLNRLYPDYPALVQTFIADDTPAEARNPVAKLLLKRHASRYLLFISHGLSGGTKVATDDLCKRLSQESVAVLELTAARNGALHLRAFGLAYVLGYPAGSLEPLITDLQDLGIFHIHYHQTLFFSPRIWELPQRLGAPYDITCHDYQALCPRINMIDEAGWYCGDSQFNTAACNRCVAALGLDEGVERLFKAYGSDVAVWRAQHGEALQKARKVIFPSHDTKTRLERHYLLPNGSVSPHPESPFRLTNTPREAVDGLHSIAVMGAIGSHKGYEILLACARNALKDGLPLRFIVIGYTKNDEAFLPLPNVVITGAYHPSQLPALIERHHCRIAALLSPWPETHSYTLSEAWRYGLLPVAFDLGAPAERIRKSGYGTLLPCRSDPKAINDALLKAVAVPAPRNQPGEIGRDYVSILRDYYQLPAVDTAASSEATPDLAAAPRRPLRGAA